MEAGANGAREVLEVVTILEEARDLFGSTTHREVREDGRGDPQQQGHILLARHLPPTAK
jgi:hypothetical protein